MVIRANIDSSLRDKIKRGNYIDFVKLLPKEHASNFDEPKLEIVQRAGQTFFVPSECDSVNISNFGRWEQAFWVYLNIYTKEHPDRAAELIQYNHIIHTAAPTYTWENVYQYDHEFRSHLRIYPERSWAIILQQAWSMCLKDRIGGGGHQDHFNMTNNGSRLKKEKCKRFNKGLCTTGRGCKYDHRCMGCRKFGHGLHICRNKLNTSNLGSGEANKDNAADGK